MGTIQHASYTAWEQAYARVYAALPGPPPIVCPNCGVNALRTEFVGDVDIRMGWAAFWCGNCMFGITMSRVEVPDGVRIHDRKGSREERRKVIPNFTMVQPPEDPDLAGLT
ncbi:MAG: hypothetical protein ABW224_15730 [Kibdelosporangium sp.]